MRKLTGLLTGAYLLAACAPTRVGGPPLPSNAVVVRLPAPTPAHVSLALTLADPAGLESTLQALHDPKSPRFRHWMTPASFGERFGVPEGDYQQLVHRLESAGLTVRQFPNRLFLEATGTAAHLESLFGIEAVEVRSAGQTWRSYRGALAVPAELSPWIQSVHGLDTRPRYRRHIQAGMFSAFGPQDLRAYYDISPVHGQGIAGQLSKVGALGAAPIPSQMPNPADIEYFYRNVSDSTAVWIPDVLPNPNNDFDGEPGLRQELELDSEMSTVAAPEEQSVTLVLAPFSELFSTGVQAVVNNHPDLTSVSVSFGICEAAVTNPNFGFSAEIQTAANGIAQGVAEGQSWFVATGDTGVDDCANIPGLAGTASADFPADIPYVTAVGGTETTQTFDGNFAITQWLSETTWNDAAFMGGAGGGGASKIFQKPSWQTGPGTSPQNVRELPDISFMAGQPGVADDDTLPGHIDAVEGTSVSAPFAAGVFALINDSIGGCRIGMPNPTLYALGAAQATDGGAAVFHDITTGSITYNGVGGPFAKPGYDEATGWGSIDVALLAANFPPCQADSGFSDAGLLDAGVRVPYDPCQVLACDGGASCFTVTEGPSACELACDGGAGQCPRGQICGSVPGFGRACVPGCASDVDCGGADSGFACFLCRQTCAPRGQPGPLDGAPCMQDTDCATGATCLLPSAGFPDGYCLAECHAGVPACQCDPNSICLGSRCFPTCSIFNDTGCRPGYACDDPGKSLSSDVGICLPPCGTNADCQMNNTSLVCHVQTGQCILPGRVLDAGTSMMDAGPPPPPRDAGAVTLPVVDDTLGKKPGCGCGADGGAAVWTLGMLAAAIRGRRAGRRTARVP